MAAARGAFAVVDGFGHEREFAEVPGDVLGEADGPVETRQRITPSPASIDRNDRLSDRSGLVRCCRSWCSLAFPGIRHAPVPWRNLFEYTFEIGPSQWGRVELVRMSLWLRTCPAARQAAARPPGYRTRRPPSATTYRNPPRNRTCLDPQYSPSPDGQAKPGRCHTHAINGPSLRS